KSARRRQQQRQLRSWQWYRHDCDFSSRGKERGALSFDICFGYTSQIGPALGHEKFRAAGQKSSAAAQSSAKYAGIRLSFTPAANLPEDVAPFYSQRSLMRRFLTLVPFALLVSGCAAEDLPSFSLPEISMFEGSASDVVCRGAALTETATVR